MDVHVDSCIIVTRVTIKKSLKRSNDTNYLVQAFCIQVLVRPAGANKSNFKLEKQLGEANHDTQIA